MRPRVAASDQHTNNQGRAMTMWQRLKVCRDVNGDRWVNVDDLLLVLVEAERIGEDADEPIAASLARELGNILAIAAQ